MDKKTEVMVWILSAVVLMLLFLLFKNQKKPIERYNSGDGFVKFVIEEAKKNNVKKEDIKNFFLANRKILMVTFVANSGIALIINNMPKVLEDLEKNFN